MTTSRADELRAALTVAELEEQLLEAKQADGPSLELKAEVREARRLHREIRDAVALQALEPHQRDAILQARQQQAEAEQLLRDARQAEVDALHPQEASDGD